MPLARCADCIREGKRKSAHKTYWLAPSEARTKARRAWYNMSDKARGHRRQRERERYHTDGERVRAQRRTYYAQNPDKFKSWRRRFYLANKAKVKAWNDRYWARRIQATGESRPRERPEVARQRYKAWCVRNPLKAIEHNHRRRTRHKHVPGSHTGQEWVALLAYFGGVCLVCGCHDRLTADHVVPLARGGSDNINNLQPLCRSCNSAKGMRTTDHRDPEQLQTFLAYIEAAAAT